MSSGNIAVFKFLYLIQRIENEQKGKEQGSYFKV